MLGQLCFARGVVAPGVVVVPGVVVDGVFDEPPPAAQAAPAPIAATTMITATSVRSRVNPHLLVGIPKGNRADLRRDQELPKRSARAGAPPAPRGLGQRVVFATVAVNANMPVLSDCEPEQVSIVRFMRPVLWP
jgi:hypothetical protein